MTLKDRVLAAVEMTPGLSDRQLADALLGVSAPQQSINIAARALTAEGSLVRTPRSDGKIGNYVNDAAPVAPGARPARPKASDSAGMSEDTVKGSVAEWLEGEGWSVHVKWGHERGIDIEALRGDERWVIEAKGSGSLQPMRVNYFITMLGETLQRMDDPNALYSIALPDMAQYRGLWDRLPRLAKSRTTISLILVGPNSKIEHLA